MRHTRGPCARMGPNAMSDMTRPSSAADNLDRGSDIYAFPLYVLRAHDDRRAAEERSTPRYISGFPPRCRGSDGRGHEVIMRLHRACTAEGLISINAMHLPTQIRHQQRWENGRSVGLSSCIPRNGGLRTPLHCWYVCFKQASGMPLWSRADTLPLGFRHGSAGTQRPGESDLFISMGHRQD